MFKTGLSTCGKPICEELFKSYCDAGIDALEISVDKTEHPTLDLNLISQLSKKYGITIWSYHLPFAPFDKINPSVRSVRDGTLVYFEELISKASKIGVDKFVVHPSGETEPQARAEALECARETFGMLAKIGKKYGATIAVEVLPRTCLGNCSEEINYLISADDSLRVCLDTNHLLKEDIVDFIHNVGDKIITTHVSDYDFVDEKHWMPGEGKLDFSRVLKALKEVGYNGPWLYEVHFKTPDTIKRSRMLCCEDIARNAKELFEGKEITLINK